MIPAHGRMVALTVGGAIPPALLALVLGGIVPAVLTLLTTPILLVVLILLVDDLATIERIYSTD